MKNVLIAYSTKTGTTEEIAKTMATQLLGLGIESDVKKIGEIRNIEPYNCIIIGAPVQGMKWHPDALDFVQTHKNQFQRRLVGFFLSSYLYNTGRPSIRNQIPKILTQLANIVQPDLTGIFGGRVEKPMPWVARLLLGVPKDAELDTIQWEGITEWTKELAKKIEYKQQKDKKILMNILD